MTLICVDHSHRSLMWRPAVLPSSVLHYEYNHTVEKHLEIYNPRVFLNISLCNKIYEG